MQKKNSQKRKIKIATFLLMSIFTFLFFGINRSFAVEYPNYQMYLSYASTTNPRIECTNFSFTTYTTIPEKTNNGWYVQLNYYPSNNDGGGGSIYANKVNVCGKYVSDIQPSIYNSNNIYQTITSLGTNVGYGIRIYKVNGIYTDYNPATQEPLSDYTRIISTIPVNSTTTASSTVFSFGSDIYINENDYIDDMRLRIQYYQYKKAGGGLTALEAWESAVGYDDIIFSLSSSGYSNLSTTTDLSLDKDIGEYRADYIIEKPVYFSGFWSNIFGSSVSYEQVISTTTYFTIYSKSISDLSYDNQVADIEKILSTSTILSTACSFVNGSVSDCLYAMFIPNEQQLKESTKILKDGVLTKFPLGYITSIVSILSTSSTSTLPVIDATIPSGVVGAGSHIYLSLDSLSWIFNATSTFTTGTLAGKSLFEIVNPYWEIFVYLSLFVYIASRILGAYVISQEVMEKREFINRPKGRIVKINKK